MIRFILIAVVIVVIVAILMRRKQPPPPLLDEIRAIDTEGEARPGLNAGSDDRGNAESPSKHNISENGRPT